MKKLLTVILAVSLVLALAACGNKDDKGAAAGAASTSAPAAGSGTAQEVKLAASNWKYDQQEYRVKKGQPVKISLDNKEGMHSAAISELKVNLDGTTKTQTFTPDKTGTFIIKCTIPCGAGHMDMKSKLIVE